ncbi:MAG: uroporphyrinogen decarboxylase family protein [Planctomycetota bacterium]
MNHRERMLRAIEFSGPDRIPVFYHPSEAGLFVHGRRLLDLFNQYPPDNPARFDRLPEPPPGALKSDGTFQRVYTDEWGTVWEHRVAGLQGQPREHPIKTPGDMETYRPPAPPPTSGPAFEAGREATLRLKKEYLVFDGWIILFEKAQELMPADEVFMNIALEEPAFLGLLDRLTGYYLQVVKHLLAKGVDVIMFGDDWAMQQGPIISPKQFRSVFRPRMQPMFDTVRAAGAKVLVHCCGCLGALFDELADMGFDCVWHQANRYDARGFAARCQKHKIAAFIHPDRQNLIPRGTPDQIRRYIKDYADIYHGMNGGGIFYVEIENDAPFENAEALVKAVHEFA